MTNKLHYLYKITCLVTGKFYVGIHSTRDLDDGYLGSGKLIRLSVQKHGAENHQKEILEFCNSREELKSREKQIVTEDLLSNPTCLNLQPGGGGGLTTVSHAKKFHHAGWKAMNQKVDSSLRSINAGKTLTARVNSGELKIDGGFIGKQHTESTKLVMSLAKKGRFKGQCNPNFGKRNACVSKGSVRKRIPLSDLQQHLDEGWTRAFK